MADFYYLDGARNQQGPVPADEIARLIHVGTIRRDTMVWSAGMPDWRAVGQVSEFASLFAQPGQQGAAPSYPGQMPAGTMDGADRLVAQLGVWGLFWRSLVAILGNLVVIPAPWTATMVYRYFAHSTWLPDGRRLTFAGTAGDIWYVFVGLAILGLVGQVHEAAPLITLPLSSMLNYLVFRWLCAKVGSEDGTVKLEFRGGFWGYVGWSLLVFLSLFTIIGWAWVLKFFVRWMCRNISGSLNFDFAGTGWGILWRTVVFGLAAIFIIPIPWLIRWLSAWFIGQVRVENLAAHFD
jgi:hypothetical protein